MIAESKAFKFLGLSKLFVALLLATNIGLFYIFTKSIAPSYNILINVFMQFFSVAIILSYAIIVINSVRPLFFPFSQGMMALFFIISMMLFAFLMGSQFCLVDGLNFMTKISGGNLPYLAPVAILFVLVVVLAISYEVAERRGLLRTKSAITTIALAPFMLLAFKSLYLYYASIYYSELAIYIPYYIGMSIVAMVTLVSLTLLFVSPRFAVGRFQVRVQSSLAMRLFYLVLALYSIALALVQFSIFSGVFLLAAIFLVYIYLRPTGVGLGGSKTSDGSGGIGGSALVRLCGVNGGMLAIYIALNMYVFYPIFVHTAAIFAENMVVMGILMVIVVPLYPLALRLFRSL